MHTLQLLSLRMISDNHVVCSCWSRVGKVQWADDVMRIAKNEMSTRDQWIPLNSIWSSFHERTRLHGCFKCRIWRHSAISCTSFRRILNVCLLGRVLRRPGQAMKRRVIPRGVQFRRCCDVRSAAVVVLFDIFDPQNLSAVTDVRVEFIVHPRKRRGGTKSLPFDRVWHHSQSCRTIFFLSKEDRERMTVCPKHRYELTSHFQKLPSTCSYPTHAGETKKTKTPRRVNKQMSEEIYMWFKVPVPIGSGKCDLQ